MSSRFGPLPAQSTVRISALWRLCWHSGDFYAVLQCLRGDYMRVIWPYCTRFMLSFKVKRNTNVITTVLRTSKRLEAVYSCNRCDFSRADDSIFRSCGANNFLCLSISQTIKYHSIFIPIQNTSIAQNLAKVLSRRHADSVPQDAGTLHNPQIMLPMLHS